MWHPKGVIFDKPAQLPILFDTGRCLRMYHSVRIDGRSHIRFFDMDEDLNVVSNSQEALCPGDSFDSAGVMPSCIDGDIMYYTGWHLRQDVPYGHAIGAAQIRDDGKLERLGAVLEGDQIMNSPYVENGRMLYCNGTGWIGNYPTYNISLAIKEGDVWRPTGEVQITHNKPDEAISRVTRDPSDGSLYYSWRTKDTQYRLASQHQDVIVERSNWDSDMQCYPFICIINSVKYMFYNGNNYGATGIGVAEWKQDIA